MRAVEKKTLGSVLYARTKATGEEFQVIRVSIISGFLGAGKTTLIKKLIAESFKGEKVILLENEYGEIGIDGGFMKESGIQVTELNSGCICCTLVGDFHKAIDELIGTYHLDRLIIEPSGVGKLSEIRAVIEQAKERHPLEMLGCATVVDGQKCRMYIKNFGEFFTDQIKCAETVILSRTQHMQQEKLIQAVALLREVNPDARIVTTPWEELSGDTILSTIESPAQLLNVFDLYPEAGHHDDEEDEHEHHCHHDEGCECEACEHEHHHDENCEACAHEHHRHDDEEHEHHDGETKVHRPHRHHHHHHHCAGELDADDVFENFGVETAHKFSEEALEKALSQLSNEGSYGVVLRSKGIVPAEDGTWLHFDFVPEEYEIRRGAADYTGRLCVIGSNLKEKDILCLFGI